MSAQTMADAFAPSEAAFHAKVMQATWGHLAPKKNKIYRGSIVYAVGCFGSDDLNPTAIACEFKGLDDSPWFFNAMTDFLGNQKNKPGYVYKFVGTFRNYTFDGTTVPLLDANKII